MVACAMCSDATSDYIADKTTLRAVADTETDASLFISRRCGYSSRLTQMSLQREFSFKPLNKASEDRKVYVDEGSSRLSEEINECSLLSDTSKLDSSHNTGSSAAAKTRELDRSVCLTQSSPSKPNKPFTELHQLVLSPSVQDLLKPSKKTATRESEEVRIIRLYQHALRLCSSEGQEDELSAKPLLESIIGSFLLKHNNLPKQLHTIKFATCKLLGGIYMRLELNTRAIKLLSKAVQLDRNDLCLWLRLFRISTKSGQFETAMNAIDHILDERPSHPIALPLALPFYLAISQFETCLELSMRSLKMDPLDERALYCVQRILRLQPSLLFLVEDILSHRSGLLAEPISCGVYDRMDFEVDQIRTVYREQLDAEADKRVTLAVDFPEPLESITWDNLLEATLNMYDHLESEPTSCAVLNLLSLLPDPMDRSTSVECVAEVVADEVHLQLNGDVENVDTSMDIAEATSVPDETNKAVEESEMKNQDSSLVLASETTELTQIDEISEVDVEKNGLVDADVSVVTNPVTDTSEKRRSSRARTIVDLTDGVNRYRTKRGWGFEAEQRATPVRMTKPAGTIKRSLLIGQLSCLLPKVFRELGTASLWIDKDPSVAIEVRSNTPSIPDISNHPSQTDEPDIWSTKSVANFITMLNSTRPNIVTFGIALLLQVAQLTSRHWSSAMGETYVALFSRLRCSLPRAFISPRESCTDLSDAYGDSSSGLATISDSVLQLREPPSLAVLTRFHVSYVELRLEQLERVLAPTTATTSTVSPLTTSRYSDPRANENEPFLTPETILTLLDVFSLYELNSPGYLRIRAHFLWINYLLCSLVGNYTEMQEYAELLVTLLKEDNFCLKRSYSTSHGALSTDYVRTLLSHLSGVSEFGKLTLMAKENRHTEVLSALIRELEQSFNLKQNSDNEGLMADRLPTSPTRGPRRQSDGFTGLIRSADLLNLLRTSIQCVLTDATVEDPSECNLSIKTCYRACSLLLRGALIMHDQDTVEEDRKMTESIAGDALGWLCECWDHLSSYPVATSTSLDLNSSSIKLVSRHPLQLGLLELTDAGNNTNDYRIDQLGLSIGEACYTVSVLVDWFVWRMKHLRELGQFGACRVISLLFEHLLCLEQSVPHSMLPRELSALQVVDTELSDSKLAQQISTGSLPAPPSLALLHLMHELWNLPQKGHSNIACRERPSLLSILRQLFARSAKLLQSVISLWSGVISELSEASDKSHSCLEGDERDGSELDKSTQSEDEFVNPIVMEEDETVACVSELQPIGKDWPSNTVSMATLMASTIQCLLPCMPFREYIADGAAVCELVQRPGRMLVDAEDGSFDTFRWVGEVLKLLGTDQLGTSHAKPSVGSSGAAWWREDDGGTTDDTFHWIDWACMKVIYHFCRPNTLPEYDSVKTLSINTELLNLLLATTKLLPQSEQERFVSSSQVENMMQHKAGGILNLIDQPIGLSNAIDFYLNDLRVCPKRTDSWAALGLIYYSELEQVINLTNLRTERIVPDAVTRCLRCFDVALTLMDNPVTLLIERGCLAYQIHSYASRLLKKSSYRSFPEQHLNLCRTWRQCMLQVARTSYNQVLHIARPPCVDQSVVVHPQSTNEDPNPTEEGPKRQEQANEEAWLCLYMIAKCSEKEATAGPGPSPNVVNAEHLLPCLRAYQAALEALDAAGAKYPKKVIVYHKLPFRAVEAIEVFYRIHALALKTLLHNGPPVEEAGNSVKKSADLSLLELFEFLVGLQSCEFVASAGKPRRGGKKRTATTAGLVCKPGPAKQPCETQHALQCSSATAVTEKSTSMTEQTTVVENRTMATQSIPSIPISTSSQDEFVESIPSDPAVTSSSRNQIDRLAWAKEKRPMALELVLQRLPLHYKAMYRLADLYFRAPHLKDVTKSLSMLLGSLDESHKVSAGGLFKDRKQNNFFHGVWRIPTSDIDRSGNFAAHMYRSVQLTLSVLKQRGDWRHLVHIFHQLRKQPPEEKRGFLGEGDRVYLAKRAFNLIQPTLHTWLSQLSRSLLASVRDSGPGGTGTPTSSSHTGFLPSETLIQIYRLHCVAFSRNSPTTSVSSVNSSPKSGVPEKGESPSTPPGQQQANTINAAIVSGYADVLLMAYRLCPNAWDNCGPDIPLQAILKRCMDITVSRMPTPNTSGGQAAKPSGSS